MGVIVVVVVCPGTVDGIVSIDSWPRAKVVWLATVVDGATVVEVVDVDVDVEVVDVVLLVVVDDGLHVGTTPKFCAEINPERVPQYVTEVMKLPTNAS